MKVAVWMTGHAICDTVAKSLAKGFNADLHHVNALNDALLAQYDVHLAYGILRGAAEVFKACSRLGIPWFNADNAYFGAGHYDGFYRISYQGTQSQYRQGIEADHPLTLKPFRSGSRILVVPPTPYVCEFFNINMPAWLMEAIRKCDKPYVIKYKDGSEVDFTDVHKVITFNSSLGWKALAEGIEVDSDPKHSVVGSYYVDNPLPFCDIDRNPLMRFMAASQFTLKEIEQGKAWELVNRLMSG